MYLSLLLPSLAMADTTTTTDGVTTVVTNGGDDSSYLIPLPVPVVYDGVTYDNVYATTNSVITFGRPDGTYWTYPSTPSVSIESRDWWTYPNWLPGTHFNLSVSNGGFQVDGAYLPFGTTSGDITNIVITGQILTDGTVSYTYTVSGPTYGDDRTGATLTDGSVVTLEQAGIQKVNAPVVLAATPVETVTVTTPVDTTTVTTPVDTTTVTTDTSTATVTTDTSTATVVTDTSTATVDTSTVDVAPAPQPAPQPQPRPVVQVPDVQPVVNPLPDTTQPEDAASTPSGSPDDATDAPQTPDATPTDSTPATDSSNSSSTDSAGTQTTGGQADSSGSGQTSSSTSGTSQQQSTELSQTLETTNSTSSSSTSPDSLSDTVPLLPKEDLLVPHIQEDIAGAQNGGIQFFGTKSQPQVIGEDGKLTPPPPPPGSGLPIPPDAITIPATFIGQPGGMTFNSSDVAVPVDTFTVTVAIPGAQALADAYVALANIGNDMSPITRKKAKKILVTTVVLGQIVSLRRRLLG